MVAELIDMIEKIWASDPPYEIVGKYWTTRIKDIVNPGLNFGWLPKPYQKPRPPIAIASSSPDSGSVKVAGRKGWSVISSTLLSDGWARQPLADCTSRAARRPAARRTATIGASCRVIHVAATDEEARARVYSAESGYRHFFGHMHKVYTQLGRLGILKTRPDMTDAEVTVDTFIEQRTDLRLAQDRAGQARRDAREGRAVRHAAVQRDSVGRAERGVGARVAEPHGAGGDAGASARRPRRRDKPRDGLRTIARWPGQSRPFAFPHVPSMHR